MAEAAKVALHVNLVQYETAAHGLLSWLTQIERPYLGPLAAGTDTYGQIDRELFQRQGWHPFVFVVDAADAVMCSLYFAEGGDFYDVGRPTLGEIVVFQPEGFEQNEAGLRALFEELIARSPIDKGDTDGAAKFGWESYEQAHMEVLNLKTGVGRQVDMDGPTHLGRFGRS